MSNDPDEIWQQLRATRWNPPAAAAGDPERRRTYVAALEQAEQLMRIAAGQVGPAASPLLLFYGLSQAGRAIAAAATALTGDDWRLKGHGITVSPGSSLTAPDLADITLATDKDVRSSGSFTCLSQLLDSPLWPSRSGQDPVRLDALWDCLPECWNRPLGKDDHGRRTIVRVEHQNLENVHSSLIATPVWLLPDWIGDASDVRAALDEYLKGYCLGQLGSIPYVLNNDLEPEFTFHRHSASGGEVTVNWELPEEWSDEPDGKRSYLESFTRYYRGNLCLFPAFGSQRRQMHPLMAWWAVLFTLSMLARYEPDRWMAHIDVDSSPHAVALEQILANARTIVPHLVLETLQEVAV